MKINLTVYGTATDTNDGTNLFMFSDERERDTHLFNFFCEDASDEQKAEFEAGELDLHECVQEHSDYMDTFNTDDVGVTFDLPGVPDFSQKDAEDLEALYHALPEGYDVLRRAVLAVQGLRKLAVEGCK